MSLRCQASVMPLAMDGRDLQRRAPDYELQLPHLCCSARCERPCEAADGRVNPTRRLRTRTTWGFTEEAKAGAGRARRRDEREELRRARAEMREAVPADADEIGKNPSQATETSSVNDGEAPRP